MFIQALVALRWLLWLLLSGFSQCMCTAFQAPSVKAILVGPFQALPLIETTGFPAVSLLLLVFQSNYPSFLLFATRIFIVPNNTLRHEFPYSLPNKDSPLSRDAELPVLLSFPSP